MKPSTLSQTVATLRAAMWLNSLSDALDSGVLCIHPGLSEERATRIARELNSFHIQLRMFRRDLDMPGEVFATIHLRQWVGDALSNTAQDEYPLVKLLDEQRRARQDGGDA